MERMTASAISGILMLLQSVVLFYELELSSLWSLWTIPFVLFCSFAVPSSISYAVVMLAEWMPRSGMRLTFSLVNLIAASISMQLAILAEGAPVSTESFEAVHWTTFAGSSRNFFLGIPPCKLCCWIWSVGLLVRQTSQRIQLWTILPTCAFSLHVGPGAHDGDNPFLSENGEVERWMTKHSFLFFSENLVSSPAVRFGFSLFCVGPVHCGEGTNLQARPRTSSHTYGVLRDVSGRWQPPLINI